MTSQFLNVDTAASYATEDNLTKALERKRLAGGRYMVVRNRAGRFTAIFPLSLNPDLAPFGIAHAGFHVVG